MQNTTQNHSLHAARCRFVIQFVLGESLSVLAWPVFLSKVFFLRGGPSSQKLTGSCLWLWSCQLERGQLWAIATPTGQLQGTGARCASAIAKRKGAAHRRPEHGPGTNQAYATRRHLGQAPHFPRKERWKLLICPYVSFLSLNFAKPMQTSILLVLFLGRRSLPVKKT